MRELFYDRCVHTGNTELLGQWDERNAPLTPKTVSYGSKKKLWWHCREGHSWQAAVYNRSAGAGCPYCAGKAVESGGNDLASVYPELAKQWDAVKNAVLRMVFAPTVTEIRLPHHMWINLRDGIDFWTVVIILVDSVEIVGDKLSAGGFTGFQCCSNLFDGFALWIEFHAGYVDRIG